MDIQPYKQSPWNAFLEIARRSAVETSPKTYTQFCQGDCYCDQPHTCEDHGLDEWYRCTVCNALKIVRVR